MKYYLREKSKSELILKRIEKLAKNHVKIMHVCGTHEVTITRFGLRKLLPPTVELLCGPGCPVCVTSAKEIDLAIKLAFEPNVILTTFGDMFRTPGSKKSLADAKAEGANVKVVYGIDESIGLAHSTTKQVVHFAIGFETTAPSTAVEILENLDLDNFSIISSHRLIPPAMDGLLAHGECEVDGFICPGHVSTIIGSKPYEHIAKNYDKPCVIAGFEPHDVLLAILMILRQLASNQSRVEIEYKRSVRPNGNFFALGRMWKVFEPCDVIWRGVGLIPGSGFKLRDRFAKFDVKEKIGVQIKKSVEIRPGCKCGEIMKGVVKPRDCPFFKTKCTPEHPLGACIVSIEGPCNVAYRYGE